MSSVNLIPRSRVAAARRRRAVRAWIGGGAVYGLALGATCLVMRVGAAASGGASGADLVQVSGRIDRAVEENAALQGKLSDQTRRLEAALTVGEHPDWSLLLEAVSLRRGGQIVFESVELARVVPAPPKKDTPPGEPEKPQKPVRAPERYTLRFKGYGAGQAHVLQFVRRLEELEPMTRVEIRATKAQTLGKMPVTWFDVECELAERPVEETP